MNNQLAVSEVFYSIQGEGSTVGKPAVFLRLKSCNLTCGFTQQQANRFVKGEITEVKKDSGEWFCDTVNVFLKGEKKLFEDVLPQELVLRLKQGAHLIITGGEPLLQEESIYKYIQWFERRYHFKPNIELETNGTISPYCNIYNYINCSPKLSNSGISKEKRYNKETICNLSKYKNCIFKFVISKKEDWDEIVKDFIEEGIIEKDQIWLMPAASTREELLRNNQITAQIAIDYCVNFTSRIQVEVWDKTTGV